MTWHKRVLLPRFVCGKIQLVFPRMFKALIQPVDHKRDPHMQPASETGRDLAITFSCFRNCENMISIAAVEEVSYRQSRLCRLLGNPFAFTVVSLLAETKEVSTGEIARAIGRSVPRTSNILGALRLAEVGGCAELSISSDQ